MKDLPHNLEAERNVISVVLQDGAASLSRAMEMKITADCFYSPANNRIWRAILWLHNHNRPIETSVLTEELTRMKKLDDVGGVPYLTDVTSALPSSATRDYWIEKLRESYVMRRLAETAAKVGEMASEGTYSVENFVAETMGILSIRHATENNVTLEQATQAALDLCTRIQKGEMLEEDKGMSWPWQDWDKRFGNAQPGELIVLAARPSRGKSSCGRQIAWHWASHYGETLLFSREMPLAGLPQLFAQSVSGVSWKEFRRNEVTGDNVKKFVAALEQVKKAKNLSIFDRDRTLAQLTARAKAISQMRKPKAMVVDYLQRFDPQQEKGETRDMAIGRFTMALKDLAVDLHIPVILLAQVSRGVEKEDREPRLSDLRESGNIENDADRVLFIHTPSHKPDGTPQDLNDASIRRIHVEMIQAKGRSEGCDKIPMWFNRPVTSFEQQLDKGHV